jgi:LPXTG-motif cell wall-anchored protein
LNPTPWQTTISTIGDTFSKIYTTLKTPVVTPTPDGGYISSQAPTYSPALYAPMTANNGFLWAGLAVAAFAFFLMFRRK